MRSALPMWVPGAGCVSLLVGLSACATTATRPPAAAPTNVEFLFPEVPPDLAASDVVDRHQRAWRLLQSGDQKASSREFAAILKRMPDFYPAETGLAYVELAGGDEREALERFDRVLGTANTYVPALVGRGQALLELKREDDALVSFQAALAEDPSLPDVGRRVEVLTFRRVQEEVAAARSAAEAGRLDEAKAAYERALGASPESPFLLRELGVVQRRRGEDNAALEHFRKAASLDPTDAASQRQIGELLEEQGDLEGALRAFIAARSIDPSAELDARIERLRAGVALSGLPAEYREIQNAPAVKRADLAALLGVKLDAILQRVIPRRAMLMTDTRGHWASPWILSVAGAGVMDVFPNHTFQPATPVQRGDLAQVTSRVLNIIAAEHPGTRPPWTGSRPRITDVDSMHPRYPAVAASVAAGVLPLLADEMFMPDRPVSGVEASEAVDRLAALARGSWTGRGHHD